MISSNSNNLIGHKDLFKELFNLHDKNLLPSKLLFTGSKGIGKNLLSLHLINYIFSIDEDYKYDKVKRKINDNNKSNKLVINNLHPNLINIELKKSNYLEVKSLIKDFTIICLQLCEKIKTINESLKNIEPKNESKQ